MHLSALSVYLVFFLFFKTLKIEDVNYSQGSRCPKQLKAIIKPQRQIVFYTNGWSTGVFEDDWGVSFYIVFVYAIFVVCVILKSSVRRLFIVTYVRLIPYLFPGWNDRVTFESSLYTYHHSCRSDQAWI